MPLICDICGKTGIPDDEIVQYENKLICPPCKDGYFQRLREGATTPNTPGMMRRLGVLSLHLGWTVMAGYLILALVSWGLIFLAGKGAYATDGAVTSVNAWARAAWAPVLFALGLAMSLGAALLTVRCTMRQLGLAPKDALRALAPPLLIILLATGIPAALLCAVLVLAWFIGFLLAALLTPYFLTILFALAYLLWLKLRAR